MIVQKQKDRLHMKFVENWLRGFRKGVVQRLYHFTHVYSPGAKTGGHIRTKF